VRSTVRFPDGTSSPFARRSGPRLAVPPAPGSIATPVRLLAVVLALAMLLPLSGSPASADDPAQRCSGLTAQDLQNSPTTGPDVTRYQLCLVCIKQSGADACGLAVAQPASQAKPAPAGPNANPCAGLTPVDLKKPGSPLANSPLTQCQLRCMPISGGKTPSDAELQTCIAGAGKVVPPTPTVKPEPTPTGKPLCEEAYARFPNTPRPGAAVPELNQMQVDYDGLQKSFERAILRFEKEGGSASIPDQVAGSLGAASWLQNYGGTIDAVSRRYVFTPESEVNRPLPQASKGTEQALFRAMQEQAARSGKRLSPEDVLYLALRERSGNVRDSLLLAHNTLRGLARQSDTSLTGVAPSLAFIDRNLEPLRTGASPEKGAHYGDWYHLFGTAYFEVETRSEWGPAQALGVVDWVYDEATAFVSPDSYGDPTERSSVSNAANATEQWFRATKLGGNQAPDPQKYCANVYGAKLGAWLYNYRVKNRGAAPPAPTSWGPGLPAGGEIYLVYSPVTVTWEGDGQRMTLDQKTASLAGYYPLPVVPYYEARLGTWGVAWIDPGDKSYRLTFEPVKSGDLHLVRVERQTGKVAVYAPRITPGEQLVVDVAPGSGVPDMKRADGTKVGPTTLQIAAPAPPGSLPASQSGESRPASTGAPVGSLLGAVALLGGLFAAVAVVVVVRRPRRARRTGAGAPRLSPSPTASAGRTDGASPPAPATMARFCRLCGQPLSPDAQFCADCGGQVKT
jgi:hypothetical protein